MGFVVLHMEKAHGSDSGTTAHIERSIIPKNADPTRTHLNRRLIEYPDRVKDRSAAIQRRLEEAGLTRKVGSNQVRAIRINVSATHEDMERIQREGRLNEWCADNLRYFADTFGKENIVAAHLHMDEKTPHMHVTLVPIVKGERKRRKREEQAKKRYRKKPADSVRLCADDIMSRLKLKSYQDSYAAAMAKYGLQRGIDGSEARHVSTQQYYRDIKRQTKELKAEVVELQEQKDTAREELTRTKKEIQTERLKGAATTAAANIAESVGSLFGNNKVKTLERENTALHREAVRRRYYDTAEIEVLPRYLCRGDGEIRAAKGHRRLESSPQVHAAVLSGYTETLRRPQSGSGGFATAERNGTGGTKTGEKRNTDREAERGGNHRSRQHRRERRFSFREQQGQDAGKGEHRPA